MPDGRPALVYDRDCRFCTWSAATVLRWDSRRRLRPVALGTPGSGQLLAAMPPPRRAESWHLVGPDGQVRSAGAAAPTLLRLLGADRLASLLARFPAATDRAYRTIAKHRRGLGKLLPDRSVRRARELIDRRS
jgi:predicted DCC family thiol-disulfide oxidoreductase YuxK